MRLHNVCVGCEGGTCRVWLQRVPGYGSVLTEKFQTYIIARADPGFLERGGSITESGGPNNLGGSGGMPPWENFRNFDCKWCIFNQFRPSTKS